MGTTTADTDSETKPNQPPKGPANADMTTFYTVLQLPQIERMNECESHSRVYRRGNNNNTSNSIYSQ